MDREDDVGGMNSVLVLVANNQGEGLHNLAVGGVHHLDGHVQELLLDCIRDLDDPRSKVGGHGGLAE